jgi:hypothetical protein
MPVVTPAEAERKQPIIRTFEQRRLDEASVGGKTGRRAGVVPDARERAAYNPAS